VNSAKSERGDTQDQVAARVAKAYLAGLRADADVEAVQANVDLAKAVLEQTQSQKEAGTGTGIEVTRARVQLSDNQQKLLVATNERRRARLQLLREVGLRLDTDVELVDKLTYTPIEPLTLEAARAEALKARADWRAQQDRENQARLSSSATKMERLPSVVGFADYGSIGTSINNALPTRTYGVSVRIPVFDGGRRDARRGESASQHRQERIRTNDLRDQIELELRVALDAIGSADEQVKVALEGLTLAENELNQARRRYSAGVASSLEVTDAQTRLERARDNRIAALFNYNVARIDLAQAQGNIQRSIQ
jgi:outer membrane protein TolC